MARRGLLSLVRNGKDPAPLAQAQYGLFSREQMVRLAWSRSSISRCVRSGRWERVLPGVYSLPGVPHSRHQDVTAAWLWAGLDSAASGRTSVALHGVLAMPEEVIDITTNRKLKRPAPGISVHHTLPLPAEDVTRRAGIPVTVLDRALYELAGLESLRVLERCVDDALRQRLLWLPHLQARLKQYAVQGRNGTVNLRTVLEARVNEYRPTDSPLEDDFFRLLERNGLPRPEGQFFVPGLGRIDFAYPEARIAIELDGYEFHWDREAFMRDRRRGNRLLLGGWLLLRYTHVDVHRRELEVVWELRRARARVLSA